jgi:hypothetical protein
MHNVKQVGVWLLVCNCSTTPWKYLKVRHPYNYWMTIYKIWISLYLPGSHNFDFKAAEITTQSSLQLLPYNTYKTSHEWRFSSSAHVLHMYHGRRLIPWDPYYCCCCDVTDGWDPCTLARVHLQNSRMLNGGERFRRQERWIRTAWEVGGYQSLHGCVWVVIHKWCTSHQISYRLLPIILRSRNSSFEFTASKGMTQSSAVVKLFASRENDNTNHWKKHRQVGVIAAVVAFIVVFDKFRYDLLVLVHTDNICIPYVHVFAFLQHASTWIVHLYVLGSIYIQCVFCLIIVEWSY